MGLIRVKLGRFSGVWYGIINDVVGERGLIGGMLGRDSSSLGLLLVDIRCMHGVARYNCCHRYGSSCP